MTDFSSSVWFQTIVTLVVVSVVVGIVAGQMRRDRQGFSVLRVLVVSAVALLGSLPFAAAFWWSAPHDADRSNPYLLAAMFVPVFVFEAWGISHFIRKRKKNSHPSDKPDGAGTPRRPPRG